MTLRAVLRHLLFQTYDHLGSLIVLNLVWTLLNLPWCLVACLLFPVSSLFLRSGRAGLGVAAAGSAICIGLLSPPTAALLDAVRNADRSIGGRVRLLVEGFRRRFWLGQALGLLLSGAVGLLLVNVGYYAGLRGFWRPVGWILLGIVLWTCIGLCVVAPMWIAAAVRAGDVWKGFFSAAHLVLSYPGFCVGASIVTGLLLLFGVATGVGLFAGATSVAGLWVVLVHQTLSSARDGAWPELSETRSLRELWRPWEWKEPGA